MTDQPHEQQAGRTIAWCHWHNGLSDTVRLVRVLEQATTFGGDLFACALCRQKHGLTPIGDQP